MSFSLGELEQAARAVIQILKTIPEFASAKLLIIGGMGIMKYAPGSRTTDDVDFLITAAGAPQTVKARLLAIPNTPFEQRAQIFLYRAPSGRSIQIDMTPDWQSPYVPPSAAPISSLQGGAIPYISPLDLLIFKISSCGLRATSEKKIRDAVDAEVLASILSSAGPLSLSSEQHNAMLLGLNDVISFGQNGPTWWRAVFGL